MPPNKKSPEGLPTRLLSRGFSLARASLKAGLFATGKSINHIEALVSELSQLKGTAMKVGQTLSLYGESLFPKEVNDLLKTLQQKSEPLPWSAMEPVIRRELGDERYAELEISQVALASASIGQVYRARVRSTGEELALKVQYPGIDEAVDADMKLLKVMLALPGVFPGGLKFDHILAEIKDMFRQELDYEQEMAFIETFRKYLAGDDRYRIPKTYPRYSTRRVLATELVRGHRADAPEVLALSQERRNQIGELFFALYLRELLDLKLVQTDPHLGNYLVEIDPNGAQDRLVLFDFGAVRSVPEEFLNAYQHLMAGGLKRDGRLIEKGGRLMNLLQPGDSLQLIDDYIELCFLLTEPFASDEPYDWGGSDLPKRVAGKATKVAFSYKLRAPPRELVFLDRKLGGVFIFLSVLKCKWAGRTHVLDALKKYRNF